MTFLELLDTPRIFTALAEWTSCFIYILIVPNRFTGFKRYVYIVLLFVLFILYQMFAGSLSIFWWIPGMIGAIVLIFGSIYLMCNISSLDSWFLCVRAFVLAEFVASFGWQIYVWWALKMNQFNMISSLTIMLFCFLLVFIPYYFLEKKHFPPNEKLYVSKKELLGASSIAIVAFGMSNLSFMAFDTPFSTTSNSILYVRTLIDFGGLVMLFSQQDKREEFRLRSENEFMNHVLERQYDHYQMAQGNMELLRREFHDMKHFLIAMRSEPDAKRREYYLEEFEQALQMHEALSDTGNRVLDVILTTKSAYCIQRKISFNCMADGSLVDFIAVKDICSIFGNAIDNAIECVKEYSDSEKRIINLYMYKKNQLLMIQIENYCENTILFQSSLPKTTKSNARYHGYGLKSIKASAEKYNGSMTIQRKENWFTLQILIPFRT